jgi:hypothetical protein
MLPTPNASPCAKSSIMVPSDDEFFVVHIYAFKSKHVVLASEVALLKGNVSAQRPNPANAEQVSHSTHIQPLHQSALPGNIIRAP